MAGSGEWLGVAGAARSPQSYWWYVGASGWRQTRPDATGTVSYEVVSPYAGWRRQVPERPPDFSSNTTSEIAAPRSIPLTMS